MLHKKHFTFFLIYLMKMARRQLESCFWVYWQYMKIDNWNVTKAKMNNL